MIGMPFLIHIKEMKMVCWMNQECSSTFFDSIDSILDFLNRDYIGYSYELSPVIFNYDVHQQPQPHFFHSYAKQTEKSFKLKKSTYRKRKCRSQDEAFVNTCTEIMA